MLHFVYLSRDTHLPVRVTLCGYDGPGSDRKDCLKCLRVSSSLFLQGAAVDQLHMKHRYQLNYIHWSCEQLPQNCLSTLCSTLIRMLVCSLQSSAFTPPLSVSSFARLSLQSRRSQGSDVPWAGRQEGRRESKGIRVGLRVVFHLYAWGWRS